MTGIAGWLFWSVAHIYFLIGVKNRLMVALSWLWNYLTFERGARLITGYEEPRRSVEVSSRTSADVSLSPENEGQDGRRRA